MLAQWAVAPEFEDDVLEEMMRTFDSEALRAASGDVFDRIYEYFLAEFSKEFGEPRVLGVARALGTKATAPEPNPKP